MICNECKKEHIVTTGTWLGDSKENPHFPNVALCSKQCAADYIGIGIEHITMVFYTRSVYQIISGSGIKLEQHD